MRLENISNSMMADLRKLGLNQHEAKVYEALLHKKNMTTNEISRLSGVPRASTYDILDSLIKKGLASLRSGKYKYYSAASIDILCNKRMDDIKEIMSILKEKMMPVYSQQNCESDPLDYIEIIKNPEQVHEHFKQLLRETKEEIVVLAKAPYSVSPKKLKEQVECQSHFKKTKVIQRCIYEISDKNIGDEWLFDIIEGAIRNGKQARVMKELPIKMAVVDSRIAFFLLEDPVEKKSSVTTIIIKHKALASSLKILFDFLWAQAEDYQAFKQDSKREKVDFKL